MGIKEVSTEVVKSQKDSCKWHEVHCSEDSRYIELINHTLSANCKVLFDINNIATVELWINDGESSTKRTSKTMAASRWHINTAINSIYKAAFNPELLTSKDLPFVLTANDEVIAELTDSLEWACKDNSVDFGFLRQGTTSFEKGIWLVKLHAKISGETKPVFDLIFGKDSYESFAHILFNELKEKAA